MIECCSNFSSRLMTWICIVLFMIRGGVAVSAQEPLDSVFLAEMEDSVSAMAIKPVEHPEELLMQVLQRLEEDLKQRHSKRDYKVDAIFNVRTPPLLFVNRTFSIQDDNGIDVMNPIHHVEDGPLHFEGPFRMTVSDSTDVEFAIDGSYSNTIHLEHKKIQWKYMDLSNCFNHCTLDKVYKGLLNVYDVTAYSIEDEAGRGVYRIHLDERKPKDERDRVFYCNQRMKWYLDHQTMRLMQINNYSSGNGYQNLYRHDFEEENGSPILKKAVQILAWGRKVMHKVVIQLEE